MLLANKLMMMMIFANNNSVQSRFPMQTLK